MTKVKVIKPFRDKYCFSKVYAAGEEYEFSDERAENMVRLGLAEVVTAAKKKISKNTAATEDGAVKTEKAE